MESKTVKIIDEHGIDRNASVVCGFKVDGLDYVLYWIERDGENDNLFTSKVVKNIDGTFSMVNIEDSMEKSKVTELVKKLVTFAINDDSATVTNGAVTLSDGTKVEVFPTLFNKEQNINVSKTYITTVKKSVTKVSEDFYKVKNVETPTVNNEQPFFEAVKEEIQLPEIDNAITNGDSVQTPEPVVEPVSEPVVTEKTPEPVVPEISVIPPVLETPEVKVEPTVPEEVAIPDFAASIPTTPEPIPEVKPEPAVVPNPEPVLEPAPEVVPPVVAPTPALPSEPVTPEPVVPTPQSEPFFETNTSPENSEPSLAPATDAMTGLVLDGSKEINLTGALGETNIPVSDVSALREFGQEDVLPATETEPSEPPKAAGFANNKYFLVVAFVFFIASCAFLGYEVFKYLQVK